jgi:hypothetical protein
LRRVMGEMQREPKWTGIKRKKIARRLDEAWRIDPTQLIGIGMVVDCLNDRLCSAATHGPEKSAKVAHGDLAWLPALGFEPAPVARRSRGMEISAGLAKIGA